MECPIGTNVARRNQAAKRKADSSLDNTESTGLMYREIRLIREHNERYQDFNMLMRLGRKT
jgi:hypothetical protein